MAGMQASISGYERSTIRERLHRGNGRTASQADDSLLRSPKVLDTARNSAGITQKKHK